MWELLTGLCSVEWVSEWVSSLFKLVQQYVYIHVYWTHIKRVNKKFSSFELSFGERLSSQRRGSECRHVENLKNECMFPERLYYSTLNLYTALVVDVLEICGVEKKSHCIYTCEICEISSGMSHYRLALRPPPPHISAVRRTSSIKRYKVRSFLDLRIRQQQHRGRDPCQLFIRSIALPRSQELPLSNPFIPSLKPPPPPHPPFPLPQQ